MSKNYLLSRDDITEFHNFLDDAVKRCKTAEDIQYVYEELNFELYWTLREASAVLFEDLSFDPIILEVRDDYGTI